MITIMCKHPDENCNSMATFRCNDNATLTQALYAFVKATQFEGYSMQTWENIIEKLADPINGIDDSYSILDYLENALNP